jgi:hypothetical protein
MYGFEKKLMSLHFFMYIIYDKAGVGDGLNEGMKRGAFFVKDPFDSVQAFFVITSPNFKLWIVNHVLFFIGYGYAYVVKLPHLKHSYNTSRRFTGAYF